MSEDRTAMVTGASRGIGRAIALALAEDSYDVAITARTVRERTSPNGLPGSLDPGIVVAERVQARPWFAKYAEQGKPPEVVGAVVAWVLRQPDGTFVNGRTIRVDEVAERLGLLPAPTA